MNKKDGDFVSLKMCIRDRVYDYTGFVQAQQEMELKAQVSGQITAKYFKGGDNVSAGQTLYAIDPVSYTHLLLIAVEILLRRGISLLRKS